MTSVVNMDQSLNTSARGGTPESLQEQLRVLHLSYASRLPDKVKQINDTWHYLNLSQGNGDGLRTLHRIAHSLAGSAATFGFYAIGEAARTLEIFLKSILTSNSDLGEVHRNQIDTLLAELNEALAAPTETQDAKASTKLPAKLSGVAQPRGKDDRVILLLDTDAQQAADMATQLEHFGYIVKLLEPSTGLNMPPSLIPPAAVIVDIEYLEDGIVNSETITSLRQRQETPLSVIFLSSRDELPIRLGAVRAGGDAYFSKPVDVSSLVDKLDVLTAHQAPEPYRVLILDDEPALADLYAFVLQQAGMTTVVINHPLEIVQPLVDFRPDLILMDVNMPGCNGLELATAIRQQEAYVSIPIVFISTETNLDRQMAAMRLGGDDFLTKPIPPDHLMAAVTARAQRSRILRSLMERDSLTGLFNHTKTKEQLDIEVGRARRQETTLSLAMIDIDHFKSVNDRFGHPAGDRVLKSLARLLQQRLRKTDIIGRYGGEEFAIILQGADGPAAMRILDEIRDRFSQIRHLSDTCEFSVTFSAGIATLKSDDDSTTLNGAADRLLYEAKAKGRNRVLLSP